MDLNDQKSEATAKDIQNNLTQILQEHTVLSQKMDFSPFVKLITDVTDAEAIFLIASGRSGFAMRAIAMRLMHLGFQVYFVGETITPAIKAGDVLWAASGSGTTGTIVKAAEKAKQAGAKVLGFTTNEASTLAKLANTHILIPAAEKQDHGGSKSRQYAGSLFEQAVLLIGDAIFMELWKINGTPAEELWKRHANME